MLYTIFKPKLLRIFLLTLAFCLFLLRGCVWGQNIAAPYDILINEFMPDPSPQVYLPNSEFIELYNRSTKQFNLAGFKFYNGSVSAVLPNHILKSNSYVIIYTKKSTVDYGSGIDTIQVPKLITLSNPGDTFHLVSPQGIVIDAASYDLSFYQSSKKAEGGWTLERKGTNMPCNLMAWTGSEDLKGGTPGRRNSVAVDSINREPLEINRYYLKDDKNVVLIFNKSLDRSLAVALPQYQMSENIKISSIEIASPLFQIVQLKLGTALQPKMQYQLFVKNTLKDCQGTPLSKTDTLILKLPEKMVRNDLIVNEILTNPETGGSRFVEFYNRSDKAVDMANLKIGDATKGDVKAVTSNILLLPNQYTVLTENPSDIENRYKAKAFRKKIIKNKLPTWDEKAGNVILYTIDGNKTVVLDSFNYQKSWHNPLLANTEGVSLERINPNVPSEDAASWQSAAQSVGFATPGQQNSQFYDKDSSSVSTNSRHIFELEKKTFSPDGDGFEDFLRLNYRFDKGGYSASIRIFNDNGKLVKTLISNELLNIEGTLNWEGDTDEGLKTRLGIYIITIEWVSPNGQTHRDKLTCVVSGRL